MIEIDLSEHSYEQIQIFTGDRDQNLDVLAKHYKTSFILRSSILKFNSCSEDEQIQAVIKSCFDLIDMLNRLSHQDLIYLISLAGQHRLQDFKVNQLVPIGKTKSGKLIYPKTLGQANYCDALKHNPIVFATGVAGTGKTYLAVAYAVHQLKQEAIQKIILTRPAVEAGESLGFLPGDMKEKVDPYLRPLYDALYEMLGKDCVDRYLEKQVIEIAPLAFMRGRTLNDAVVILDEAQNTTQAQMKMFLTRMGKNTQLIINGDITQIDLVQERQSGLKQACSILKHIHGIEIVTFDSHDVVRHPLVQKIIERYAEIEK